MHSIYIYIKYTIYIAEIIHKHTNRDQHNPPIRHLSNQQIIPHKQRRRIYNGSLPLQLIRRAKST